MIEITIGTENEAFCGENIRCEVVRILRMLAQNIEDGGEYGNVPTYLFDINGNRVGRCELSNDSCRMQHPDHDCEENAVPYESDGPLGHGFECSICGEHLQAG